MRVRVGGSHHQKFVVIRHRDDPTRDIAYVGGIDLCHSRRDDVDHGGDPQAMKLADEYGATPPWHDIQAADLRARRPRRRDGVPRAVGGPDPAEPQPDQRGCATGCWAWTCRRTRCPSRRPRRRPVEGGTHVVQLLRTYPDLRRGRDYEFAHGGERSVARGYSKALARARRTDLRRGPVPLGPPRRQRLHRGAQGAPRPARRRGGAAVPGPRRRLAAAAAARPAPVDARDDGGGAGPGGGLRHREPRGHAGLRARQGLRHRRHLGDDRLRQLQPALLDARLRAVGRRRRPGPRRRTG